MKGVWSAVGVLTVLLCLSWWSLGQQLQTLEAEISVLRPQIVMARPEESTPLPQASAIVTAPPLPAVSPLPTALRAPAALTRRCFNQQTWQEEPCR